jgi:hypothetical protein
MPEALKEFANQLAENVKNAPGWLPLLALVYLLMELLPEDSPFASSSLLRCPITLLAEDINEGRSRTIAYLGR